jgi:hypothetical protein
MLAYNLEITTGLSKAFNLQFRTKLGSHKPRVRVGITMLTNQGTL